MANDAIRLSADRLLWTDRQGVAFYVRLAFAGTNLEPYWKALTADIDDDADGAGLGMDLSVISQLLGDLETALSLQTESLRYQRLFRSPCSTKTPKLRVLALAAETDIGGNTPIEFLLDGSDVELITLYVTPGVPLAEPIPDHDIAIVIASADAKSHETLNMVERLAQQWPRPMLNLPKNIRGLDRRTLGATLSGIPGLQIPPTNYVSREKLISVGQGATPISDVLGDGRYPIIIRPVNMYAGIGLEKLDDQAELAAYLERREEQNFFVSAYVDFSSEDGMFRKYRVVLVDGKAYACHMAIDDRWRVSYQAADMILNESKRLEEAHFMTAFDEEFAARHKSALAEMSRRIGLEYFAIDCAETKDGKLLIFDANNTAIVHDMDSVEVFPYKAPAMRKIFNAFVSTLYRYARKERMQAA